MSSDRKKAHIELAHESQTVLQENDLRFNYEPLLKAHPRKEMAPFSFLGKTMRVPIWISSMTGGTEEALYINRNLAAAAKEFGLGMGLGSCRYLLEDDSYPEHFMLREIIGYDAPFYANLGIAQIEKTLAENSIGKINTMMDRLQADGLIIHVNPLQELLQPEGDNLNERPIKTIKAFLKLVDYPVVVKEVGQGMGPESLKQLLQLPLQAIDFAAFGGTNFAKLELLRNEPLRKDLMTPLAHVGNDVYTMLDEVNSQLAQNLPLETKELILSGGIKTFLDGYYGISKSKLPAIYGQASNFLKYARKDYRTLKEYIEYQIKGLQIAQSYLTLR